MVLFTAIFQEVSGAPTSNKKVECVHASHQQHTEKLEEFERFLATNSDVIFWANFTNLLPSNVTFLF